MSDCVGRMQISLPEVADVAAVTPEAVVESDTSGNLPSSYFSDSKGGRIRQSGISDLTAASVKSTQAQG
jgi:hypothetical protein